LNLVCVSVAVTVLCAAAGITAGQTAGLKADQVLVVANSDSPESLDLAKSYAAQRKIPNRNVITIKTSTAYMISRKDYQAQISTPIAQAMLERRLDGHIRAVCLVWGIPVRIAEGSAATSGRNGDLAKFYKARAGEALVRMAVCSELLLLVGKAPKKLPEAPADRIENVDSLFDKPLPAAPAKMPSADELFTLARKRTARRQVKVRFMSDGVIKQVAERQLMALQREMYGLRGLIDYIKDSRISNPPDVKTLGEMLRETESSLARLVRPETPATPDNARKRIELLGRLGGLRLIAGYAAKPGKSSGKPSPRRSGAVTLLTKTTASVDSELALLWDKDHQIKGALANPLSWRSRRGMYAKGAARPKALMTARIDGPSAALARRMVIDSIAVEKSGLKGVFYVDSGLPARFAAKSGKSGRNAYQAYDNRFRALAGFVSARTKIKVVVDTASSLFAPGKCPDAAMYAGWYSLRKYVAAFKWKRGAVGWHTASFEAAHLRDAKSREWCPQMIVNGVAATLGAVDEPLLTAFPAPEQFFALLLTGKYTIAECYWRTTPKVSWQMTLIADPLYNPFKANPQITVDSLPKALLP